ncbi:MAG: hypothetical protein QM737_21795 [Ferruginibacter sp.]
MHAIIVMSVFSAVLFVVFMVTLIIGIIKKNKKTIFISLAIFILFGGVAAWTGFQFARKSYNRISETFKPRTGEEIYTALFGQPQSNCLKVINHQDQVVPKIDYAIWLEFETCPQELKRILAIHHFTAEKIVSKNLFYQQPNANDHWFSPSSLGDSIFVFKYAKDEYGNGQTFYSSLDSTKVFCVDILD